MTKKDPYAPLRSTIGEEPSYWRSIEHKEGHESVVEKLDVEFPSGPPKFDRREALKLAGVSAGVLGALSSCGVPVRRPVAEILPFVRTPEKAIPGVPQRYATAMPRSQGALGLVVEANDGRPTKIEGNPLHPASLGATDVWAQAEILRMYDPARGKTPIRDGRPPEWISGAEWVVWDGYARESVDAWTKAQGQGLALIVEDVESPTRARLLQEFKNRYPKARVVHWDPLTPDATLLGAELAFGAGKRVRYDLSKTKVIFSLDADFLGSGPEHLALTRAFSKSRAVESRDSVAAMKRLYSAEGLWSLTGSNADHRLRIAPSLLPNVLKALAKQLGVGFVTGDVSLPPEAEKFVAGLAKDLKKNGAASVVLVGERQDPALHALGHAINAALGSAAPQILQSSFPARESMYESLAGLVKELETGAVQSVVVLEANPVYTAPGGLKFADALKKAKVLIHAGLFAEETGAKATWHLPLAHFLESWGDARAFDGTVSLVQPLIRPIFGARVGNSILAQLAGVPETSDLELLKGTWSTTGAALADGKTWRKSLHDGLVPGTTYPVVQVAPNAQAIAAKLSALPASATAADKFDLVAPYAGVLDGRLTDTSWVMELPDGMSKLVWDNAALIAPATAEAMGIRSQVKKNAYVADLVELEADGRKVRAPVFVLPGVAEKTIVLSHGYGRDQGYVAKGVGVDVNPILGRGSSLSNVKVTRLSETRDLCSTQDHFSVPGNPFHEITFAAMTAQKAGSPERKLGLDGRPLYRSGNAAEFEKDPAAIAEHGKLEEKFLGPPVSASRPSQPLQLNEPITYDGQQWGMVIDLSSCTGCNACAIACQAENNIPTVGREQVLLGREMHWIRIDRYFMGDINAPKAVHQPVPCMQCENAPCEPVCPVSATVHDEEGLNSMAYNRCIGTRYCSNNCPYKVRRFNYLDFTHTGNVYVEASVKERMKSISLQRNPDVTVRYRGVMEKCTYCTQRIEAAKIHAKQEGKDRKALPDGAVTPACAQVCPAQAITFGNVGDLGSKVSALKKSPRNYEMLQELNVRPRTTYLARIRNENEELT